MSRVDLSEILAYDPAPAPKEHPLGHFLNFVRGAVEKAVTPKKIDLTATAANLDDAQIQRLRGAKEIHGSNEEFQGVLVALAIKSGLIENELPPHFLFAAEGPEAERLQKVRAAAFHTIDLLIAARKESVPTGRYKWGVFQINGPFLGERHFASEKGLWARLDMHETGSPLQRILNEYEEKNPAWNLKKAHDHLQTYSDALHDRVEQLKNSQAAEAERVLAPVRDRILGRESADALRERAVSSSIQGAGADIAPRAKTR